jgi:hypothetical protein
MNVGLENIMNIKSIYTSSTSILKTYNPIIATKDGRA